MKKKLLIALCLLAFHVGFGQEEAEKAAIETLLREFLEKVDEAAMHDRFWAEDLVYTSSSGMRHGKSKIMAGFESAPTRQGRNATTYDAEEVQIRIFGDVAVLNFILIGKNEGVNTNHYLNSGTLVKRNGEWKVVNWHATVKG